MYVDMEKLNVDHVIRDQLKNVLLPCAAENGIRYSICINLHDSLSTLQTDILPTESPIYLPNTLYTFL